MMKVSVNEQFDLQIEDIENHITIKTKDGHLMFLKMEDNVIKIWWKSQWYESNNDEIIKCS